jgi:N-sulfoglucosamine sulfohydrolase
MPCSRRQFFSLLAVSAAAAPNRPNILILLADNWAAPHASVYGDPVVNTPVFDRLAREGALFTQAYAANPSCAPSRSSLLTGLVTHRLGEGASLYGPLSTEFDVYPDLLEKAGYNVGFSGKGWGPGTPAEGGRKRNPVGPSFASLAEFLAQSDSAKPFCFWFGSNDPHVPWNRGRASKPALDASKVKVPPHVPDHPAVRDDILNYYCEVQQFDRECGTLLELLRDKKLLDNTLIVMTSDNGWQIPRGLANCYDLGVHVPMAIRWPGRARAGLVTDAFVSLADLFPTFLEAAGLPVPKVDGRSLAPLLAGKPQPAWDHMFLERERHANVRRGNLSYPVRGIRTRDYLYLRNLAPDRHPAGDPELYWAVGPYGDVDGTQTKSLITAADRPAAWQKFFDLSFGKRPAEELYDLRADPGQIHNVAGMPQHRALQQKLSQRVTEWMRATGDPRAKGWTDFWDKAPYSGYKVKAK